MSDVTQTLSATDWAASATISGNAGDNDTLDVVADNTDISADLTLPTLPSIETGNLIGSAGTVDDTITLRGAQLNAIVFGGGKIDLGLGSDTINLKSTSTILNGLTDGNLLGVETISAATAVASVTINISGQSEAFTITGSAEGDALTGGGGGDTFNLADGDFDANESIDGGGGTDAIVLTEGMAVDFSAGTISNVETLTGSSDVDTVTMFLAQWGALTTIDLGDGADTLNVIADVSDISGLTGPSVSNVETGNLVGTDNGDAVTLKGEQLDAIVLGTGTIDLGDGTDTINLKSTSTVLNTLLDGNMADVEVISASTAAAGVTIDLSAQSDGFTITGSAHGDTITGSSGADIIDAGLEADIIVGFTAGDDVEGGGGSDTLTLAATSAGLNAALDGALTGVEAVSAALAGSAVTINLSAQSDGFTITGSAHGDTITGSSGGDLVNGGGGNDAINGSGGVDTIDYSWTTGGVNVNLLLGQAFDITGTQAGTDALSLFENVLGGTGADTIVGDTQANDIQGGGGIDKIWGGTNNDTIHGDADNDILVGGVGGNAAGSGNDTLFGDEGADQLFGEDGNDILWGGDGVDQYAGGDGSDTLHFEADGDTDTAWGGAGSDTFVFKFQSGLFFGTDTIKDFVAVGGADVKDKIDLSAFAGVTFANLNIQQVGQNVEITAAGLGVGNKIVLEILNAGALTADDFIFAGGGGSPGSTINGNSNNNTLTGTANAETIDGKGGNDTIAGLGGADVLIGGSGTDTATYAASGAAVYVSLVTGSGAGGDAQGDTFNSIENVIGSGLGDTIEGSSGTNNLNGGGGVDTLSYLNAGSGVTVSLALTGAQNTGGAGSDTISNFENLTGSTFADTLTGNSGANVIDGLAGTDRITTGGGDDTVIFRPGYGSDTVTDFVAGGATDKIDIRSFSDIHTLAELLARATQSGANTVIDLSGTADGVADDQITLNGVTKGNLTDADFIFAPTGAVPTNIALTANTAAEGAAAGTAVGTLSTVDADSGQTYTYSLVDSAGGRFAIGGVNGDQIVVAGALNYEAGSAVNVTVRVTDSGHQTFDKVLTINLGNLAPTAQSDTNGATNAVAENAANGATVGLTVTSNDPNGGATYSIVSGPSPFTINPTTGVVTVINRTLLDFETQTSYTITVKAEDSLGSVTADYTIAVTDVAGPTINGSNSGNTLTGTGEGETINGNGGNDTLRGLGGADTLNGGTGADTMRGGAGNDNYVVDNTSDTVDETADSGSGVDTVQSSITFSLGNLARVIGTVENLTLTGSSNINGTGTDLDNVITGNSGNNNLSGLGGVDTINGGSGNDTIAGGDGNDTIIGGAGNDNLNGGNHIDTLSYETATGGVTVSLAITAAQSVGGGAGTDTVSNFEDLTGSGFGDTLTGNDGANVLAGLAGNDTLNGGLGTDRLIGGLGTDTLNGGADADTFVFTAAVTAQGMDTISGFVSGVDVIEISAAGFGGGLDGPVDLIIGDGPPASPAGDAYFFYDNTGPDAGRLYFVPESGSAFVFAQLSGAPTLAASDILIV